MKLTCPNGHSAVVRHDPNSTGMLAMCDVCGWTAPKVKAELDRAQREEAKRRELAEEKRHELAAGEEEEESHGKLVSSTARRRAD